MEIVSLPFPQESTAGRFSWPDEFDPYAMRRPRFDLRPVHLRQNGTRASVYPITSAVSIIPLMSHTHLHLNSAYSYWKDKRAKHGSLQTMQYCLGYRSPSSHPSFKVVVVMLSVLGKIIAPKLFLW